MLKDEIIDALAELGDAIERLEVKVLLLPDPIPPPVPIPTSEPKPTPVTPPAPIPSVIMQPVVREVTLNTERAALLERLQRSTAYKAGGTREQYNLDGLSQSGRLNDISRHLWLAGVPVIAALRVTGSRRLLERLFTVSQNLRGTLSIVNGFRGWVIHDPGTQWHGGVTVMEMLFAHAFIAQLAWTFRLNKAVDAKYAAEADFWQKYLQEDFLARWHRDSGKTSPPFFEKNLMHPYAASIRLSHYLWKLTGSSVWLNERDRQLVVLHKELIPVADRYQWSHWINSLRSIPVFPIQHGNYSGETITSFADMGFESILSETVMRKLANTVTFMLDGGSPNFMKNANGVAGLVHSPLLNQDVQMNEPDFPRGGEYAMQRRGYGLMSFWDETGEIEGVCGTVDNLSAIQPIVGQILGAS